MQKSPEADSEWGATWGRLANGFHTKAQGTIASGFDNLHTRGGGLALQN